MTEIVSNKQELITRDAILMLLSDDETASVSTAETAISLEDGAEYLDLEQLEKGVQKARKNKMVMGRVLPRKAVHEKTWGKIQGELNRLAAK